MPALPVPQQADWSDNIYILATIRVVVIFGVAYLIKSLYNLMASIWGTRSASIAAAVADDIELEDIVSSTLVTVPGAAGAGPDLEADLTLEVHPPQPMYDPQNHTEMSWTNVRAQYQSTGVSGQYAAAQMMPEQDIGLRNGDHHIEDDMDTTFSNARRERTVESVADEGVGGTATQTQTPIRISGDSIRPPLDA